MADATPRVGPDARISSRRAARLYRLVQTLADQPRSRTALIKLGRAGMRTFYRDLTVLDDYGIGVRLVNGRYELTAPLSDALRRLPFPAPELSFADVIELSRGGGKAQSKLKRQMDRLLRT